MREKLIELAERCEGASGADDIHSLLYDAFRAIFGDPSDADNPHEDFWDRWGHFARCMTARAYESAAMTLVPEGHAYRLDGWTAFTARVFIPEKRYLSAHSNRSMALALTAAALRARAAALPIGGGAG